MKDEAGSWVVIWAESRAEKKVEQRIATLGLSTWLPTVTERHRWSDRWRDVECPLFPGYLFAQATRADWHRILQTPGVLTVVKDGAKPAVLANNFIASLKEAIKNAAFAPESVTRSVDYAPGDEVVVLDGALRGVRGTIRERRNGRQLVLWVAAIGRGVAFTIGSAMVKPVDPTSGPGTSATLGKAGSTTLL